MKLAIIGSRSIKNLNLDKYIPKNVTEIVSGGAVNGCAYAPFILTVDWLGWVCYLPDKLEFILSYHVLPS